MDQDLQIYREMGVRENLRYSVIQRDHLGSRGGAALMEDLLQKLLPEEPLVSDAAAGTEGSLTQWTRNRENLPFLKRRRCK